VRGLFWVILLAALAVAVTLGARYNAGYVLLVLHPYRIELSLNLLLAILVLAFVAIYLLVRVVVRTLRLPSDVREFRERRRLDRANRSLIAALRAFLEGRYARAEKAANELIDARSHGGVAAVIAARSAHELRAYDRRDRYLARTAYYSDEDQAMRAVAQAELLLQGRQHQEALAALERLPQKHTAALRLELKAVQLAKNWDRYLELLTQLERVHALEETQLLELRRYAIGENLARKARNPAELKDYWQRLTARERQDPKIAAAGARAFMALGGCREAHAIIEASLERDWDNALVALYPECAGDDTVKQIERAESWLASHPEDPALMLALGRLCTRQRLWGKARSYLEASLSLEESFNAQMELARLLDELGDSAAARVHYRRSLGLAESAMRPTVVPGAALAELRGSTPVVQRPA
jgi:HemY protein